MGVLDVDDSSDDELVDTEGGQQKKTLLSTA